MISVLDNQAYDSDPESHISLGKSAANKVVFACQDLFDLVERFKDLVDGFLVSSLSCCKP